MTCELETKGNEAMERINAMLMHEKEAARCRTYLNSIVNASCRIAMVDWCFVVCDSFGLSRETVGIAMSILDRYLSSGKGKSAEVLQSKLKFQLASITSFYTAVKIREPAQLGIEMLLKLCRGYYKENDIFEMEREILASLEWRICLSSTTPMDYVRLLLDLLPEWTDYSDAITENAKRHMDSATRDIYFSTCDRSAVGLACLAGAMEEMDELSSLEKDVVWRQLSRKLDFDIASKEIRRVEMRLLSNASPDEPRGQSHASLPRSNINKTAGQPSSPVSVVQAS
ncbi:hypothetical protein ACHAWF_015905 [Thalassiosira exigua]